MANTTNSTHIIYDEDRDFSAWKGEGEYILRNGGGGEKAMQLRNGVAQRRAPHRRVREREGTL